VNLFSEIKSPSALNKCCHWPLNRSGINIQTKLSFLFARLACSWRDDNRLRNKFLRYACNHVFGPFKHRKDKERRTTKQHRSKGPSSKTSPMSTCLLTAVLHANVNVNGKH